MKSKYRKVVGTGVSKKGVEYPIYERIGEVYENKISLTVPDQSIPLRTLISRYRRDGTQFIEGVYHGDDSEIPPNLERLDKMQRIDYVRANAERIKSTRAALDKSTASKKDAEAKAKFDAAVKAEAEKFSEERKKLVEE